MNSQNLNNKIKKIMCNTYFLILFILLIGCTTNEKSEVLLDNKLEDKFQVLINNASSSTDTIIFKLDTLTNFKWDTLLVFTPYTPINKVQKIININLSLIEETNIEYLDHLNILAFIRNGKLIKYCKLPRDKGDFDSIDATMFFVPDSSLFKILKTDDYFVSGRNAFKYVPVIKNINYIKWW